MAKIAKSTIQNEKEVEQYKVAQYFKIHDEARQLEVLAEDMQYAIDQLQDSEVTGKEAKALESALKQVIRTATQAQAQLQRKEGEIRRVIKAE